MSYKPEFEVQGEWCGNGQRFATMEEAEASAALRYRAWTVPTGYRAVESTDPVTYMFDRNAGDVRLD